MFLIYVPYIYMAALGNEIGLDGGGGGGGDLGLCLIYVKTLASFKLKKKS